MKNKIIAIFAVLFVAVGASVSSCDPAGINEAVKEFTRR